MAKKQPAKKSSKVQKELFSTKPKIARVVPKTKAEAMAMSVGPAAEPTKREPVSLLLDGIVGSPQQNEIWNSILNTSQNILVNARAGTGKTFTMVHGLRLAKAGKRLPRFVNFAAFTKAISNELKEIVPEGVRAGTLHSFGYSACRYEFERVYGKDCEEELNVDLDKMEKLLIGEFGSKSKMSKDERTLVSPILRLASICKNCLVGEVHDEDGNWYYSVAYELLDNLCDRYTIEITPTDRTKAYKLVETIMELGLQDDKTIDHDDMIWLPVVKDYKVFSADLLVVDECQDLNFCQHELILKAGKRLLVVGDEFQSIFGFRGADVFSVPNLRTFLKDHYRGLVEHSLTVTRRCPKSHVKYVKKNGKVKDFEAHSDAIEGEITKAGYGDMLDRAGAGDLITCRTNAPLVAAAFWIAYNRGLKVKIQGRDIGGQLVRLVMSLVDGQVGQSLKYLAGSLKHYTENKLVELRKANKGGNKDAAIQLTIERNLMLNEFIRHSSLVTEVIKQIESLFVDSAGIDRSTYLLLGCVHQVKGLEADTVWVFGPEQMPYPMARTDEDRQQEWNIWYVAHTRSKNRMVLVPLPAREEDDQ